jgi:HemY protein
MKRLIALLLMLLTLAVAAWLAPAVLQDPGRVSIAIGRWQLEMSAVVLVAGIVVVWLGLSLSLALLRLPGKVLRAARRERAQRQLENGFLALTEGDWQRAESALRQSLDYRPSTAGFLAAARAAQGRSDQAGRERWLQLADRRFGRRHFVTQLARARMALHDGRLNEAISVLEDLHLRKRRHPGVLQLLLQAYQDAGRWNDLRLLTPALRKAGIVDRPRADELAALAAVRQIEYSVDQHQLEHSWRQFGRGLRKVSAVRRAFGRRATELGLSRQAGALLAGLLDDTPGGNVDEELLQLYAISDANERAARIASCQQRLRQRPSHAGLLTALGVLYLDDRRYAEARSHLERAVEIKPTYQAYTALGRVLDHEGDAEGAARAYRQALQLSAHHRGGHRLVSLPVGDDRGK